MKWRRSDTVAVVVILSSVFVLALVAAAAFADDNPNTDEASGFGALAFIVGGVLLCIYFAVRYARPIARALKQEAGNTARAEDRGGNRWHRACRNRGRLQWH
jgi:hypothetical protein